MKKLIIRPKHLFLSMLVCVAVVVASNVVVRMMYPRDLASVIVEDGRFVPPGGVKKDLPTLVSGEEGEIPSSAGTVAEPGCTSKAVTQDDIFKGRLVPYRGDMQVIPDVSESSVNLSQYKNNYYTTLGEDMPLTKDAADGFNALMEAYNKATDLVDFAVYGTEVTNNGVGSPCPIPFSESKAGNSIDLAVMGYGSIISYDGLDAEKWVIDNCHNYGYVVRYPQNKAEITGEQYCPWHIRYVGIPHSMVMKSNNWCLEEYIGYLRSFTRDNPFLCSVNDRNYEIYSVPSMGEVTYLSVPLAGNYEISGDGSTGYIITIEK